ncbi:hypothetical protein CH004_18335 [Salmonella enterica]|nr:hypothetical protein [Salmonella enterica]
MLPDLYQIIPAGMRLIEPFVGGGSVFLNSDKHACFLLADVNTDLINLYQMLAVVPDTVIRHARVIFDRLNDAESYMVLREEFNAQVMDGPERAAAFLFLNRHCFNGLIRTFDRITSAPQTSSGMAADKMQAGVILLGFMRKELNLSNSSVLGACQKLQEAVGLPNLAPQYAIDAPAGAPDGSSRPTLALSALLKQHGIRMTANQAYQQLAKLGVVEHRERYSRSAINGIKKFWSLTAKGCMFGKNITSPANPRETQPHFFESKFPELLKLLDTVH